MIYNNNNALILFKEKYAKDFITSVFGDEAEIYANDFELLDHHILKYKHAIETNLDLIKGCQCIDIGSNNGFWPVLMYLSGAQSVTCIEPRPQFCNGINRFAAKHNFPIKCINGFYRDIFTLGSTDTITLFQVDGVITDIVDYLNQTRGIAKNIILMTGYDSTCNSDQSIRVEIKHNFHHRAGFNINSKVSDLPETGFQTNLDLFVNDQSQGRFLQMNYGNNFYETVFDYLGIEILNYSSYTDPYGNNLEYRIYSAKFL